MNQIVLTSSRLELGEEENLVVHFPACPAVLCSLPGIVGLPALCAPVGNSVTFFIVLFCFLYRGEGTGNPLLLYKIPQRQHERRGVARRLTSPRTLVVGCLNVHGCSTIESKWCEVGCIFGRRGMDVLALCETKMKGKEVAFGEVTGTVSGVERGRVREGVALLLSEWMVNKVVEWKEVSSRLMWVRVRMGRECWAFVSAYGLGCERSGEES